MDHIVKRRNSIFDYIARMQVESQSIKLSVVRLTCLSVGFQTDHGNVVPVVHGPPKRWLDHGRLNDLAAAKSIRNSWLDEVCDDSHPPPPADVCTVAVRCGSFVLRTLFDEAYWLFVVSYF